MFETPFHPTSFEPTSYGLLIVAGVLAGFINTLAGGGSLLTLPALMLLGLPAHVANGSNRLAVVSQSISGVWAFHRRGRLPTEALTSIAPPTALGALLGAVVASFAPPWLLEPTMLATLVLMALLLLLRPKSVMAEAGEAPLKVSERPWALLGLFGAGLYGGFIQAGVGMVLLSVLGGMLRYEPSRANALKLSATLIFGVIALAVFALRGQVAWLPALVLAGATVVGSQIGVRFAVKISNRVLRWVILLAVVGSCVKVLLS